MQSNPDGADTDKKPATKPINPRLYPPLKGIGYKDYLAELHKKIQPEWYLEIGTLRGGSLKVATANSIAIDPKFKLDTDVYAGKKELHLFQMTSDEFFESGRLGHYSPRIDLAFLDGMHLFEFLLRDFINTEKFCTNQSTIVLHDCIPISAVAAERVWDHVRTWGWTGDVWKLVPILRKYRPDVDLQILDCPPSGLTLVSNLDSQSTVLSENYEIIVEEFMEQTIETYGEERLYEELQIEESGPVTL